MAALHIPSASARVVRCHVVTDPAGDGVRTIGSTGLGTPNNPALDVLSADVGFGAKELAFVVRVAALGDTLAQGPATDEWRMTFGLRGKVFAATATRAPDGTAFQLSGDIPERQSAPGFTPSVQVTGAYDVARNEIRIDVPRGLLPVIRSSKDALVDLEVVSVTGIGLISADGASAGTTVDGTRQPGPRLPTNSATCVRAT